MNKKLQAISKLTSDESSLSKSFIDELFGIMAGEQFVNTANKINLKEEECIGEMNTLEKQL